MRLAINAAIIQEGEILLIKKEKTWILPGGKPRAEESDITCLCREVDEELSGTQIDNIRYYNDFKGITPHKGDVLRAKVYFADIKGVLRSPSSEIIEHAWVSDSSKYNVSDITSKILESLKEKGYLKK
jgi:ADP-ribose pyrophosphatase YjhB (NUDIX family)